MKYNEVTVKEAEGMSTRFFTFKDYKIGDQCNVFVEGTLNRWVKGIVTKCEVYRKTNA